MKRKAKAKEPQLTKPDVVAATYTEALSTGKQGYKTADSALDLLLAQCRDSNCPTCGAPRFKDSGIVKSPDGRTFQIVDKLAHEDSVGVGQKFRRFEVVEVPA